MQFWFMGTYCYKRCASTVIDKLTGQVSVAAKNIQTGAIGGTTYFLADPRLASVALFSEELILIHETAFRFNVRPWGTINYLTRRLLFRV